MGNEWRTAKLGELVAFKTGKLDSNAAVPRRKLQHELKLLLRDGEIGRQGTWRYTVYLWTKNA